MKKPFLALLLVASLPSLLCAQVVTPGGARSDEIMRKVARLDALIQIVPLSLTKEQVPALLSAIEKARQKQKELLAIEDKDLAGLDAQLSKAVDEGVEKDKYPPREVQLEIAKMMRAMGVRRTVAVTELSDLVYDACKKTLNAGQLKIMEKSLKPELLEPSQRSETMDAEAKIKFYVRKVLLDPAAYDVLLQMSKRKEPAS